MVHIWSYIFILLMIVSFWGAMISIRLKISMIRKVLLVLFSTWVIWLSHGVQKKQPIITLSTCEALFVVNYDCCDTCNLAKKAVRKSSLWKR